MEKINKEQFEDIKVRIETTIKFLEEQQLELAAQVRKINIGDDVFADQVIPFLKDLKFKKKDEENKEKTQTNEENK